MKVPFESGWKSKKIEETGNMGGNQKLPRRMDVDQLISKTRIGKRPQDDIDHIIVESKTNQHIFFQAFSNTSKARQRKSQEDFLFYQGKIIS